MRLFRFCSLLVVVLLLSISCIFSTTEIVEDDTPSEEIPVEPPVEENPDEDDVPVEPPVEEEKPEEDNPSIEIPSEDENIPVRDRLANQYINQIKAMTPSGMLYRVDWKDFYSTDEIEISLSDYPISINKSYLTYNGFVSGNVQASVLANATNSGFVISYAYIDGDDVFFPVSVSSGSLSDVYADDVTGDILDYVRNHDRSASSTGITSFTLVRTAHPDSITTTTADGRIADFTIEECTFIRTKESPSASVVENVTLSLSGGGETIGIKAHGVYPFTDYTVDSFSVN